MTRTGRVSFTRRARGSGGIHHGIGLAEIREETGLTIENPTLCGVKQFWLDNGVRYIVFLFRADKFTGELHGSEEGDAFWLPREELFEHRTVESFEGLVHVFETPECSEVYYKDGETHFA